MNQEPNRLPTVREPFSEILIVDCFHQFAGRKIKRSFGLFSEKEKIINGYHQRMNGLVAFSFMRMIWI